MARKEKKYHFIYKTTNLLSGKYYIGMHSTNNLDDGYMGSGKRLRYSINKYGKENHKVEIVEFVKNRDELKKREKEIVNLNEVAKNDCINLCVGGSGGFISMKGVKKGRKKCDEILKERYGDNFLSKMMKEFHNNMSEKEKKEYNKKLKEGIENSTHDFGASFRGKKHKKETIKLMRERKINHGLGNNNSQYGTCWITKNGINKKIKKEEINNYINSGWIKGRKIKK